MRKDLGKLIDNVEKKGIIVQVSHPDPRRGHNLSVILPDRFHYKTFYFHDIRLRDVERILSLVDLLMQS